MAIYCPTCQRNDQVKKVTAIVADQTWLASTYSGPYTGWYNTTSSSLLVKNLLANKPKQKAIDGAPCSVRIFLGVIGFPCFFVMFSNPSLGGLICLIYSVIFCGSLILISAVQYARNRRQWTNDYALWQQNFNRQYYCSRDDTVFYV
jgi:hypothetical protein